MAAQIVAVAIFLVMFVLIVTEKIERWFSSLGCGALMIFGVFGICMRSYKAAWSILNLNSFFTKSFWYVKGHTESASAGINWETIVFIAGMMIMVEGMGKAGFFRWLCLFIAKLVRYKAMSILVTFMLMSFVLSMFIDSITVILFLAAVTVELGQLIGFSPIPVILSEIFCANLGGSSTMCGDPPNIIIGTALGYSFTDFLTNTGFIAVICLAVSVVYFMIVFKKPLTKNVKNIDASKYPDPKSAIENKRDFTVSCIIFAIAVVLLVSHSATGLTVSTIGVGVGLVTLIAFRKDAVALLKKVDYKTLLFFIGLFIVVGGLEQTGILEIIAGFIEKISGGNVTVMIAIIIWISAVASAFIDNIPFAATMIPVISSIAATSGVDLSTLSWTLAMGTDIGGSATPIGASANVVGISVAAKKGYVIGWGKYCKYLAPITIIVVGMCMVMIYLRYL